MSTKATITRDEYLQLTGLLVLAERHYTRLQEIQRAASDLIGESFADASVGDAIYGDENFSADDILRKCGITVEEPAQ